MFDFAEHAVRILTRDGEPWFVAADVCRVLEIANSRDAVKDLEEDEKAVISKVGNADISVPNRGLRIISESGLYALIFRSRKPQARAFRKWVTQEVLPAIRQTGAYYGPIEDVEERDTARAKWLAMRDEVTRQLSELQEMSDLALHGVLTGRMRLTQAKVVASLVGHRMAMLRIRADLWAPEGGSVDSCPQSGRTVDEREREDLVALSEAVWEAEGERAPFETWRGIAAARGLFPWLLTAGLSRSGQRSALGKLLRRWEHEPLGNGLALRVIRKRPLAVELRRARGLARRARG